jgi:nucleotide-binding universal stress UspA family protein
MLTISRILYPTDFSKCAKHALPHTLHLAERHDAELHLLHAVVLHDADPDSAIHRLPNMEDLYQLLEAHADQQMKSTVRERGKDLLVKHAQVRGISAAGAILDYASENDIDLIVMGTHGRRGLRRLLLGSVAEEIVRLAPCPVLTVPEREARAGLAADSVTQIVVPVDFSQHADLAIAYARELAALYKAQLHLMHVVDEVVYPEFYPPVMPSGTSMNDELQEQSETRLRDLATTFEDPGVGVNVYVRSGRAAPSITDFAEQLAADLIVIASHGLTGIRHMLLGSVTEQVVRRAPCSTLTVKSFGKQLIEV